jgi:hypothetical protein
MDYIMELAVSPAIKKRVSDDKLRGYLRESLKFLDDQESEKTKSFLAGETLRSVQEEENVEWVLRFLTGSSCVLACAADVGEVDAIVKEQDNIGDNINVDINVSKTIIDAFATEKIDLIAQDALNRIERGNPVLDGKKSVACSHNFKFPEGAVSTFTTYIRTTDKSPMTMHVGTPEEIQNIQLEFEKMAKDTGAKLQISRSAGERAAARRRKLKTEKKRRKANRKTT